MPDAFKEWAVTVRALAEVEQLLTLRESAHGYSPFLESVWHLKKTLRSAPKDGYSVLRAARRGSIVIGVLGLFQGEFRDFCHAVASITAAKSRSPRPLSSACE